MEVRECTGKGAAWWPCELALPRRTKLGALQVTQSEARCQRSNMNVNNPSKSVSWGNVADVGVTARAQLRVKKHPRLGAQVLRGKAGCTSRAKTALVRNSLAKSSQI